MKILHFGKFYPPFNGGMETYLRDLSEQQAKTHTITTVVHNHDYNLLTSRTKKEIINRVNVIRQKSMKPFLFTPIMLGVNKLFSTLIEQNLADVIHISWPNPSALLLLLNRKAKSKPWVIQWQSDMVTKNSSWLLKFAYQFFKPFERALLKQASKVIVSTQEYYRYSPALKSFKKRCEFIPLAIKSEQHQINAEERQQAESLWGNAKYKIYNIARLTFYKNHQLIIQAAELLPNAMFIITGKGELKKPLTKLIAHKKLTNIRLTGSLARNKLNALMSTCDAFCLPSNDRAESFGMVLLEAINFKKTILVSNLDGSGMKWIAAQTHLGQTFDCNDAKDLVAKIKHSLSLNIQQPCKTDLSNTDFFNIENCTHSLDKVYASLIDSNQ